MKLSTMMMLACGGIAAFAVIATVAMFLLFGAGCGSATTGMYADEDDYHTVDATANEDASTNEASEDASLDVPCKNDSDCQKSSKAGCRIAFCVVPSGDEYGICNFETVAPDGTSCDDDQLCTEDDGCVQGGTCVGKWKDCNDDNLCTVDSCNIDTGQCENKLTSDVCDDDNACTQDWCEPATGCEHVSLQNGKPCEDGNLCTKEESCQEGACIPTLFLECEDYNPCTENSCDQTRGCIFQVKLNLPCDDGNACTLGDMCDSNDKCSGSAKLDCDDGESCTEDWCEPDVGCKHQTKEDGKQCEDGNACTFGEYCQEGVCTPEKLLDCKDDNPCTNDYCDPEKGCVANLIPEGKPCDDKDSCTLGNFCHNGECIYDKKLDCEDGDPCTEDICNQTMECTHKISPDGASCDDGNPYTDNSYCQSGQCTSDQFKPACLYPTVYDIDQFSWECYDVAFNGLTCILLINEGKPCKLVDCTGSGTNWSHQKKFEGSGTCTNLSGDNIATADKMEECQMGCFKNY